MATNDKYDRQLRVWGSNGQRALMQSNILLINANAVGTETIKNLILPGVGQFTVLDHEMVTENDLGNNFFVDSSSIGQPRAEVVTRSLQELNPDVKGTAHVGAISSILLTEPNYLQQFNLIIAANLIETHLVLLATICNAFNIPLVVVRSYGLIGYCRLQINHHEIVESKPESDTIDLSLAHPFPDLIDFCSKFDFLRLSHSINTNNSDINTIVANNNITNTNGNNNNLFEKLSTTDDMSIGITTEIVNDNVNDEKIDTLTHSHIPYVAILYQAMVLWRHQYGDHTIPRTTAEKDIFKRMITSMSYNINNEVNFQEAVKECHRTWFDSSAMTLSGSDSENEAYRVVINQKDKVLTTHSSFFSLMVRALQYFLETDDTNSYNNNDHHHNVNNNNGSSSSSSSSSSSNTHSTINNHNTTIMNSTTTSTHSTHSHSLGLFPVVGTLPDMTATTEYFTALQKIYHTKAQKDKLLFTALLRKVLIEVGYDCHEQKKNGTTMNHDDDDDDVNPTIITTATTTTATSSSLSTAQQSVSVEELLIRHAEDIDIFCCNSRNIRQISTRTMAEERYALMSEKLEEAMTDYIYDDDPEQTPIYYYLALRAVDVFYTRHQRYPGCMIGSSGVSGTAESDASELWVEIQHLLARSLGNVSTSSSSNGNSNGSSNGNATNTVTSAATATTATTMTNNHNNNEYDINSHIVGSLSIKHAQEMTRFGGEEYHTVSAVIGGIAAQEIVKILTHQYICINYVLVYNGICSVMNIYEL